MFELGKDFFGYLSIARAGRTGVENAEHQACSLTALRREAWIGRHMLAEHSVPETLDGDQAIQRQFVEHDEGADGTTIIGIGEDDIVGLTS